MRALAPAAALATLLLCAGCTSTVLAEPQLLVSPYLAVYQLRGDVAMQSQPGGSGPLQDNAAQPLRSFGLDQHEDDFGIRAELGDGFAGLRLDYYRLDMQTSKTGTLAADWGQLQQGDTVRMSADMDEFRIGWVEPVLQAKATFRDRPVDLKLAAGGVWAHRSMTLRARTDDGARTQNASLDGDVLYPALRGRVGWRDLAFDLEYAFSPDLVLGGDASGFQQDVEVRGSYTLPQRDLTFFAGYRYCDLPADGGANGFRYDADLVLDGFQFGLRVTF